MRDRSAVGQMNARRAAQERIKRYIRDQLISARVKDCGEQMTCTVCLEDFDAVDESGNQKEIVKVPQCNHIMHKECLLQWVD